MSTVAIVLSAFNGEKYVEEQLESLLNQSRKPDCVYISDDCSTDRTVEIIKSFISSNKLNNWKLTVNQENKGWKHNFHDLILSAKEDIIFLCDQDDIWYPEKVEEMSAVMEKQENISLLACGYDAKYEDDTRRVTKRITKHMKNTGEVTLVPMNEQFMNVIRPGCSYAVRRQFCHTIDRAWDLNLPHDAMLWRCAVVSGSAYIYDRNLFSWRRYSTSSSTFNKEKSQKKNKYESLLEFYSGSAESHLIFLRSLSNLIDSSALEADTAVRKTLSDSMEYEKGILSSFQSKKIGKYIETAVKYRRFIPSIKTFIWTVFVINKANH